MTLTGDIKGSLATDSKGRLQRLELLGTGILVTRNADDPVGAPGWDLGAGPAFTTATR